MHHYVFAHRLLPDFVFSGAGGFTWLTVAGAPERLRKAWDMAGEAGVRTPGHARLPGDGLALQTVEVEGVPGVLITLPPPERPTECWFVLVVSGPVRLLTCERMESGAGVVCEWLADGTHAHHDFQCGPDAQSFLENAGRVLRGEAA